MGKAYDTNNGCKKEESSIIHHKDLDIAKIIQSQKIIRRKHADVFLSLCGEFMGGFDFFLLDFLVSLVNTTPDMLT